MYVNNDWETVGINEVCQRPQKGRAEVSLSEDHPAIIAFRNPPEPKALLTAEELFSMLKAKRILSATDRPR